MLLTVVVCIFSQFESFGACHSLFIELFSCSNWLLRTDGIRQKVPRVIWVDVSSKRIKLCQRQVYSARANRASLHEQAARHALLDLSVAAEQNDMECTPNCQCWAWEVLDHIGGIFLIKEERQGSVHIHFRPQTHNFHLLGEEICAMRARRSCYCKHNDFCLEDMCSLRLSMTLSQFRRFSWRRVRSHQRLHRCVWSCRQV